MVKRPAIWFEITVSFDRFWSFVRRLFGRGPVCLCLVLSLTQSALAADIWCGHDDDESGAYGTACVGNDKDHDGYTTDGSAGHASDTDIDCDDTNWKIGTGAWVDAGGGTVKRCKSDGTYTVAKAVSALAASDIASTCATLKFIDDAGSTSSGCGAHGTPCDPRCLVDSGRACYVAPSTTNDCFWWLPGTYANNATATAGGKASLFYINNKDGSAAHPIINVADPTGTVLLDSPGTSSANESRTLQLDDSDYWKFYGFNVGNGYAGVGVYFNGGSNNGFYFGKIYSVTGCSSPCGNNVSGWTSNGGNNNVLRATLIQDTDADSMPDNNYARLVTAVVLFAGSGNQILFNSMTNTGSEHTIAIKNKHGQSSATLTVIGNHINKYTERGVVWNEGGATIERNYVAFTDPDTNDNACFDQNDTGGTPFWDSNSNVRRNTCVNGAMLRAFGAGPDTSGSFGNPLLTFKYNLARDTASSYAYDDVHHVNVRICRGCTDSQYNNIAGKMTLGSNCYYNTNAQALKFSFAGGSEGATGADYSGFAAWTGAGFDSGSFSESFTIGSDGSVGGSSNCAAFGAFGDASGSTTTTTVATTTTSNSTTSTTSVAPTANNAGAIAARLQ